MNNLSYDDIYVQQGVESNHILKSIAESLIGIHNEIKRSNDLVEKLNEESDNEWKQIQSDFNEAVDGR